MIKRLKVISLILVCFILFGEVSLRVFYGFGNPPLFEKSDIYGYRFAPNQEIVSFQKRLFFNSSGLRSEEVKGEPNAGMRRVLCVGDSISYGGRWLDQNDTYPYQLQTLLNRESDKYEVLNASAPSWAISNEEAYLRNHGIYKSNWVILQIGTTDLFQSYSDSSLIGKSPDYPKRKPFLALEEIFMKYISPKLGNLKATSVNLGFLEDTKSSQDVFSENLHALERIAEYVRGEGADFMIVYVPSLLVKNQSPTYRTEESRLIGFLAEKNIRFVNLRNTLNSPGMFKDEIHPNQYGNKIIAREILRALEAFQ